MTGDIAPRVQASQRWMAKARETLDEARVLLANEKPVGCANRMYYAVLYASCAAMARDGRSHGKHAAVRASLHRDYVNTGRVPLWCGEVFDELFEDRQEGDYVPDSSFGPEALTRMLERAEAFVEALAAFLSAPLPAVDMRNGR